VLGVRVRARTVASSVREGTMCARSGACVAVRMRVRCSVSIVVRVCSYKHVCAWLCALRVACASVVTDMHAAIMHSALTL
jgi:hypothetical protein